MLLSNGISMDDGLFIVLEGLDASGKRTQAERLVDRFETDGKEARYIEFPTYGETRIGELIDEYLSGGFEAPEEVVSLLYAADRYQFREQFEEFLDSGGVIVADRFSPSNYAFQTARTPESERSDMVGWMKSVESRLPEPDLVIFLDIPPQNARELMEEDGKDPDVHEEDLAFQRKVAERYRELAEEEGWDVVEVVEGGDVRSRDEIEEDIWRRVANIDRWNY